MTILRARSSPSSRARCSISRTWLIAAALRLVDDLRDQVVARLPRGHAARSSRAAARCCSAAFSSCERTIRELLRRAPPSVGRALVDLHGFRTEIGLGLRHAPLLARDLLAPRAQVLLGLAAHRRRSRPWPPPSPVSRSRRPLARRPGGSSAPAPRPPAPSPRCSVRSKPRSTCGYRNPAPNPRTRPPRAPPAPGPWFLLRRIVEERTRPGRCSKRPKACERSYGMRQRPRGAHRLSRSWSKVVKVGRLTGSGRSSVSVGVPLVFTDATAGAHARQGSGRPSPRPRPHRGPGGRPAGPPAVRSHGASGARRAG